jgi:hypothetical protein
MADDSWYEVVSDGSLQQGDIFVGFPLLSYESTDDLFEKLADDSESIHIEASGSPADIIVMTQSCDLEHDKLDMVVVCPLWSVDYLKKKYDFGKDRLNRIISGRQPDMHMIHKSNDPEFPMSVVEFKRIQTVPLSWLKGIAETLSPRLRLKSPYRERLAQAFGMYFMRIGTPVDIPKF